MDQLKGVDYGGAKRSFEYDALHRPTSDTLKNTAGAVLAGIAAYGYDDADRLTTRPRPVRRAPGPTPTATTWRAG